MDARLIALKLFLDELGIPSDTSTIENRKMIQKAVYLGQFAGADLGYRFGWHRMGPFSADLARDYYLLDNALALGDEDYKDMALRGTKREKVRSVLPLMDPPENVPLSKATWLELVSSLHYLRKIRELDDKGAKATLEEEKPSLLEYADKAKERLQNVESLKFDEE